MLLLLLSTGRFFVGKALRCVVSVGGFCLGESESLGVILFGGCVLFYFIKMKRNSGVFLVFFFY